MFFDPISHIVGWKIVISAAVGAALVGMISQSDGLVIAGVFTAVLTAILKHYNDYRRIRREQDLADRKALVECAEILALRVENESLTHQVESLHKRLADLGHHPWAEKKADP